MPFIPSVALLQSSPPALGPYGINVRDYGAKGNGVTDDAPAIQAAAQALMNQGFGEMYFPSGNYLINSTITFAPPASIFKPVCIYGDGATILVNTVGTPGFHINGNFASALSFRQWTLRGLQFRGQGTESEIIYVSQLSGGGFVHSFRFENISIENTTGHGMRFSSIAGQGGVFEFQLISCNVFLLSSATTKYPIWFDAPGSVMSSVDVVSCGTRYGKNGIRCDCQNLNLWGGTFLEAQEEGLRLALQGGTIVGPHIESCWRSAPNLAAGGGGLYMEGWATLTEIGDSRDTGFIKWSVDLYPYGQATLLQGGPDSTGGTYPFVRVRNGLSPGWVVLQGIEAADVDATALDGTGSYIDWNIRGTAAPVAGKWQVGDRVWNSTPASGGTIGWVCTTTGTPGTWKTFGVIA